MTMSRVNKIGITMGDPGGIGPEVIVRALQHPEIAAICAGKKAILQIFGDRKTLNEKASRLNLPAPESYSFVELTTHPELEGLDFPVGQLTQNGAKAQIAYIRMALAAVEKKEIRSIATAPIHKGAFAICDLSYCGHTEWLEDFAQRKAEALLGEGVTWEINPELRGIMMLAGDRLRVVPTTVHIPLKEVPDALTHELILDTVRVTHHAMKQWFGIKEPKLAVCGLNPHAGDGGLLGREEEILIEPAVAALKNEGMDVSGPYPADTVFYFASQGQFDAVIAMYHDQALAPLKLLHFEDAINITLGLPFLRTSVDHGVAYDIASRQCASSLSMENAIKMALGSLDAA